MKRDQVSGFRSKVEGSRLEGWKVERLGDVCEFLNGLWKGKKPPFVKVGVIRNTNFTKDCELDDTDIAYLDVEQSLFSKRKLQYGDIILEKSGGGPKQPVGRVVIFDKEGDFSFSNFTSVLRIKDKGKLDFRFLHKYLFSAYVSGVTEKMQSHSTGIRNLKFDEYKEIPVPLPPLPEQKRIVSLLDEAFAALAQVGANAARNLVNAREVFEAELNVIFGNGRDWEIGKLGDVLQKTETIDPTKTPNEEYVYIDVSSVNKENLSIEEVNLIKGKDAPSRARKLVKTNDVIFATVRPTLKRIAIIPKEYDGQICSTGYFVLRGKEFIDNRLVFYFLQTHSFMERMEKLQKGASYPAVTDGEVREQIITFPKSLGEQRAIVERLEGLSKETRRLEAVYRQKMGDVEELRKSVLRRAFEGEL